jgi:hypothetical protein
MISRRTYIFFVLMFILTSIVAYGTYEDGHIPLAAHHNASADQARLDEVLRPKTDFSDPVALWASLELWKQVIGVCWMLAATGFLCFILWDIKHYSWEKDR